MSLSRLDQFFQVANLRFDTPTIEFHPPGELIGGKPVGEDFLTDGGWITKYTPQSIGKSLRALDRDEVFGDPNDDDGSYLYTREFAATKTPDSARRHAYVEIDGDFMIEDAQEPQTLIMKLWQNQVGLQFRNDIVADTMVYSGFQFALVTPEDLCRFFNVANEFTKDGFGQALKLLLAESLQINADDVKLNLEERQSEVRAEGVRIEALAIGKACVLRMFVPGPAEDEMPIELAIGPMTRSLFEYLVKRQDELAEYEKAKGNL